MANVEERLPTFLAKKWIFKEGSCSAINMAKAGFICTTDSTVQCYYCDKELGEWEETDDPWQEHKTHAKHCPFVKKYETLPDPNKFTILEAVQLEKERLLMKVNRKYEETKEKLEKTFKDAENNLVAKSAKDTKQKSAKDTKRKK